MKKILCLAALTAFCAALYAEDNSNTNNIKEENKEQAVIQEEAAGKPQLVISGAATVHSNFTGPDVTYYTGRDNSGTIERKSGQKAPKDSSMTRFCAGEANIAFDAKGTLSNGLYYGATIDFDAMKDDTGVDKMYITLHKSNWGTLQIGNLKGPEAKMIFSGQQLIGGTTGIDGTVVHDIDQVTGVIMPLYMIGQTSKATKIVYYTPRVAGFQLGVSLTPDTKQHGHNDKSWKSGSSSNGNDNGIFLKGGKDSEKPSGRTNIVVGLSHFHDFQNGWGTKISWVYLWEDTRPINVNAYEGSGTGTDGAYKDGQTHSIRLRNARAYHLSASVTYHKLTIGVGYIYNGKSRLPIKKVYEDGFTPYQFMSDANGNSGRCWNIGARYQFNDKLTIAGVFHNSKRKVTSAEKTKMNILTLTADYKICDGFMLFVEFDYENSKSCDTACWQANGRHGSEADRDAIFKQKSTLVAIGAKVCF